MNINILPTYISRENSIKMLDTLISDVYLDDYNDNKINDFDFLKEKSFIEWMLTSINCFQIYILDLHHAYNQIPIEIFKHVQEDHKLLVSNGGIGNSDLYLDFIVTKFPVIQVHHYIDFVISRLYDIGLPDLGNSVLASRIIQGFITCQEYRTPERDKQVVKYHKDSNAIEILDYNYNIIKEVINIDYTSEEFKISPEFADVKIILK